MPCAQDNTGTNAARENAAPYAGTCNLRYKYSNTNPPAILPPPRNTERPPIPVSAAMQSSSANKRITRSAAARLLNSKNSTPDATTESSSVLMEHISGPEISLGATDAQPELSAPTIATPPILQQPTGRLATLRPRPKPSLPTTIGSAAIHSDSTSPSGTATPCDSNSMVISVNDTTPVPRDIGQVAAHIDSMAVSNVGNTGTSNDATPNCKESESIRCEPIAPLVVPNGSESSSATAATQQGTQVVQPAVPGLSNKPHGSITPSRWQGLAKTPISQRIARTPSRAITFSVSPAIFRQAPTWTASVTMDSDDDPFAVFTPSHPKAPPPGFPLPLSTYCQPIAQTSLAEPQRDWQMIDESPVSKDSHTSTAPPQPPPALTKAPAPPTPPVLQNPSHPTLAPPEPSGHLTVPMSIYPLQGHTNNVYATPLAAPSHSNAAGDMMAHQMSTMMNMPVDLLTLQLMFLRHATPLPTPALFGAAHPPTNDMYCAADKTTRPKPGRQRQNQFSFEQVQAISQMTIRFHWYLVAENAFPVNTRRAQELTIAYAEHTLGYSRTTHKINDATFTYVRDKDSRLRSDFQRNILGFVEQLYAVDATSGAQAMVAELLKDDNFIFTRYNPVDVSSVSGRFHHKCITRVLQAILIDRPRHGVAISAHFYEELFRMSSIPAPYIDQTTSSGVPMASIALACTLIRHALESIQRGDSHNRPANQPKPVLFQEKVYGPIYQVFVDKLTQYHRLGALREFHMTFLKQEYARQYPNGSGANTEPEVERVSDDED